MRRAGNVFGRIGDGAIRGPIDGRGSFEAEGFMRAFFVEDPTEGVEAPLLSLEVLFGRTRGVGFERSMHPLVAPVLVRTGGLDEFGPDPELDPADGELREASDGGGCNGYPLSLLITSGSP